MAEDDVARIWEMVADIDYCMFVTNVGGALRSRPMSSIVDTEARTLHFLVGADAALDDEIAKSPQVHLAYSNGSNRFVALNGRASLSSDRALIKKLWNPGAQAFWPEGPEDARVRAIVIAPADAQFWDGDNRIVSTIKFVAGLASGNTPDMGDSGKVKL